MPVTILKCVVWRSGGTDNFQWHRSLSMTPDDATIARISCQRMGYPAHVEDYERSLSIGLPESYDYDGRF